MLKNKRRDVLLETAFYTEGPVISSCGEIYVTTLLGGQMLKINAAYEIEEWATCLCPNGQFIGQNGDHFVCDSKQGSIERFDNLGNHLGRYFEGTVNDYKVTCPNDLYVGKDGEIYFTDSVRYTGAVIYIDKDGESLVVARELDYPNGVVYDRDRSCLYVAESYKNRVLKIDLNAQEHNVTVLVELPCHHSGEESKNLPDGLFLDKEDNLWIAHYGMGLLHCYNLSEQNLTSMDSQISLTSNVFVNDQCIVITGGEGEPGPGRIRIIER